MTSPSRPPVARRRVGWWLLVTLDLLAAGAAAILAFRWLGAWSGVDTNPPHCYTAGGHEVSCDLTPVVVMPPTVAAVLLVLVAVQLWQRRARR